MKFLTSNSFVLTEVKEAEDPIRKDGDEELRYILLFQIFQFHFLVN